MKEIHSKINNRNCSEIFRIFVIKSTLFNFLLFSSIFIWTHKISGKSDLWLQLYYDHYFKSNVPGFTSDEIKKFDLDFQYRYSLSKHHKILAGIGYRIIKNKFLPASSSVAILPINKSFDMKNAFIIQDEITITQSRKLTAGTKILHNVYTRFELQPGIRIALNTREDNTLWIAITRAVRTPSRVDVDYFSPSAPSINTVRVAGGPNFKSENAYPYQSGYRVQPYNQLSLSIAAFYNVYHNIYSLKKLPGTLIYQAMNGSEGKSWGFEFSGTYQLMNTWHLKSGYTYFDLKLKEKIVHQFDPSYLTNDVRNQPMLQSVTSLPFNLHLNIVERYLYYLPQTLVTIKVPSYFTFDSCMAFTHKTVEISIVGQNLYKRKYIEFNNLSYS